MTSARLPPTRPTVLVVEDDRDISSAMVEMLELEGLQATSVGTAEDALEQLRNARFDMLVTDYRLPGESGTWLLTKAIGEGLAAPHTSVLISAEPLIPETPNVRVVRKPFSLPDLVDSIRRATAK